MITLVMLFANRKGILTFDGEEWQTIRIPAIPYSMQINPEDGKIYIGGDSSFGYLEKSETGGYRYISLPRRFITLGYNYKDHF